ncbi:hypothetical protein NC652_004821 [Populus alba x Populus x berolinensis]|nr:hypothetical protein NC652_004821 [Populus alba x Populus x berolinensis]
MLLLFIAPGRRYNKVPGGDSCFPLWKSTPIKYIAIFTLFQFVYFLVCLGGDLDSDSRNHVHPAVSYSHQHQTAHPS